MPRGSELSGCESRRVVILNKKGVPKIRDTLQRGCRSSIGDYVGFTVQGIPKSGISF